MIDVSLIIFGLGYSGTALAEQAVEAGLKVTMVSRRADAVAPPGTDVVGFDEVEAALMSSSHLVATAAPDERGDPVLHRWGRSITRARTRWIGYLSATGVYGDRQGGWVDEATPPAPGSERSRNRLAAEHAWQAAGAGRGVDIFRLAGIYGPGRSAIDDLRRGTARRISKPGQLFGRIHRDDIAGAVLAAIQQETHPGVRILNLSDDVPAANADVVAEAAKLLGIKPPEIVAFEDVEATMSPMGRSFWLESRRVSSVQTQRTLGRRWLYPSYREGLRAILDQTK